MVGAKQQAVKKLLDAAANLMVQSHVDSGEEVVRWLRNHYGIDIAMVSVHDALVQAATNLQSAQLQLDEAKSLIEASRTAMPS